MTKVQFQKRYYFYFVLLCAFILFVTILLNRVSTSALRSLYPLFQNTLWSSTLNWNNYSIATAGYSHRSNNNSNKSTTLVLLWTSFHVGRTKNIPDMFRNCPSTDISNCAVILDRDRADESAAVIFHTRDMNWSDLPSTRHRHQYYVFALWESPEHKDINLPATERRDFFNLSLTYRRDSSVVWPYADFRRSRRRRAAAAPPLSPTRIDEPFTVWPIVKGKSKLVAWFVSNCKTPGGRERFVKDLRKYIPIDVYGRCGKLKCARDKAVGWLTGLQDASQCNRLLTKKYKFYLALENSLCRDYVTEKFYFTMDNSIIVPVVMERNLILNSIRNIEVASVINKSIIAVDDFQNVRDLADYLVYLDGNTTAYMEYLEWRRTHEVMYNRPMCELCRMIGEGTERRIDDLHDWWIRQGQCHTWR